MNELTKYNAKEFNLLKFRIWQLVEPEPFSIADDYDIYPSINSIVESLVNEGFFKEITDKQKAIKQVKKLMKDMAKEGILKIIPLFNTNTNLLCGRGYAQNKKYIWEKSEG